MIVLTGTTGGLGKPMLDTILKHKLLSPKDIVISSSNPSSTKLQSARDAGIEIRYADMTKPETLVPSYQGAEALYLTSYPSVGEERFEYHKLAIDAAKEAGVKHIIYTSLVFGGLTGEVSKASVMQAHINTVKYLQQSGLNWTIVREAPYAHLWNNFAGFIRLGEDVKEVVIPSDGPTCWADRDDLGEGTAHIVANWRSYVNQSVCLTGPELLTVEDVVKKYSAYIGKPIEVRKVGADAAIEYHQRAGSLPPEQAGWLPNWTTMGDALAAGDTDYLDPTLEMLLGRKPKTIDDLKDVLFNAQTNDLDTKDFN